MTLNNIDSPLESKEQVTIFLFVILYALACVLFVGILPSIILLLGIFLMKKNNDFSAIKITTNLVQGLLGLVIALSFPVALCAVSYEFNNEYYFQGVAIKPYKTFSEAIVETGYLIVASITTGVAIFYYLITKFMFYNILAKHQSWIEENGIFSNKPKTFKAKNSSFDVIKGEKLKQFSVADELLKWAKLKEDGHISEEEFNEMRNKLLQKQD